MGKDKAMMAMGRGGGPAGFAMFVAWFGALVYFVNQAQGFWEVVLAFLQSLVWPAILVYHVLQTLGA